MLLYLSMNLAKAEDNMKGASSFDAKPGDMVSVHSLPVPDPSPDWARPAILVCRGVVVARPVVCFRPAGLDEPITLQLVKILSRDGVLCVFDVGQQVIEPGWE